MPPYDDMPIDDDYSDIALLIASVREFPSEEFTHELDARVERRFAAEGTSSRPTRARRARRRRLSVWTAGPGVALVAGIAAAVVVIGGGFGGSPSARPSLNTEAAKLNSTTAGRASATKSAGHKAPSWARSAVGSPKTAAVNGVGETTAGGSGTPAELGAKASSSHSPGFDSLTTQGAVSSTSYSAASNSGLAAAPVAPGVKQIQSAQISLTTPNRYVDTVAREIFAVVSLEHGTVLNSQITAAASGSGGGYGWLSLSVPTGNLQATMTRLSGLRFASVSSRTDASQNVSHQYNADARQLADARALRISLLKQLAAAYTQTAIDSIKAQLQIAERQITHWQNTLGSLQHKVSYSNVSVAINQNGLPSHPVAHRSSFGIGSAAHDAIRVLVVAAGVALIALAALIPVGLVAALLVWLWVWLRQRRREHALDSAA